MTRPGEFSPETVEVIWGRDRGCCAMCGKALRRDRRGQPAYLGGWSVQHREARGGGGTKRNARPWLTLASNGVLMCGDGVTGCHGEVETQERARGRELGFVVSALGVDRPADVPILHAIHGLVRLTDEGGYEAAEGEAA